VAHCIKGIHDGFDQLNGVVWRLLVPMQLDHLEESDLFIYLFFILFFDFSLISLFEHKLDNNFGTEGVSLIQLLAQNI
jgi:hypothetical protein